jgi:hypothetical protein
VTKPLEAIYDGHVLRLIEPLDLKPNVRLRIIVETSEAEPQSGRSFLQTARALKLEGPSDWSVKNQGVSLQR